MRYTLLSALSALAVASPTHTATTGNNIAPLLSSDSEAAVPDKYIVVFKKDVEDPSEHFDWLQSIQPNSEDRMELRKRSGDVFTGLKHTYEMSGFMGYSGHFDEETIKSIQRHSDIEYIERDSEVYLDGNDPEIHNLAGDVPMVQKNASWGLARISQRNALKTETYNDHLYAANGGAGVDVYVIDSGTNIEHVDFEGRATWLKTVLDKSPDQDTGGHGTHCSGTLVGKRHGVAKKANLYSIKVFGGGITTTTADIIKGIQYAVQSHESAVKSGKKGFKGSVVNMSLSSSGYSHAEKQAIDAAIRSGLHFAVAAGNQNTDACTRSPAAYDNVITVGSSNLQERRVSSSNYGKCVDIFAPGDRILSTFIGTKYATAVKTGTSMAAPHVAGLVAYMLSLQPDKSSGYAGIDITPQKLKANILAIGTVGALSGLPNETKNLLLWNGGGSSNLTEIIGRGGYIVKKPGSVGGSEFRSSVLSL
ncbi:peptidase S8/S53 domain-containing protein [Bipolaris maydis]|nr:peptidase S8/S53 domain-containing protein [Bipolaris maydis]